MGYHVFYNGRIDIAPPLTVDDACLFQTIINPERQDKNIFNTDTSAETIRKAIEDENEYLSSFPLDLKDDLATLEDTGNEERPGCAEWLTSLIQHFFAPRGYVLDGDISWGGDNIDDRGTIYIHANQLEAVDDEIDNPGPSWERAAVQHLSVQHLDAMKTLSTAVAEALIDNAISGEYRERLERANAALFEARDVSNEAVQPLDVTAIATDCADQWFSRAPRFRTKERLISDITIAINAARQKASATNA